MKRAAVLTCVFLWLNVALADEFNAKVIMVMDGDTLLVLHDGAKVKIRMANIDAPEKDQAFGMESRQSLLEMVQKKQVHINSQAVDQYGRVVGLVSVDGRNINEEQVRRGMAWEYSHFHSDRHYIALQSEAQQARRGLWAQSSPLAPWQWRKTHPAVKAGVSQPQVTAAPSAVYDTTCGHKKYCSQMSSCEEAHFYLTRCGVKSLDRNKNGVPCEELCMEKKPAP
jgi:endonuclease YncB( thermonuclease family)